MKRLIILAIVVVFLMSNRGYSQFENISRTPQIELFGGLAIPLSPESFKDYYNLGYSIHGQYVIFPSPKLGISFAAAYEPFTFNGDKFLDDYAPKLIDILAGYGVYADRSEFSATGQASILEIGVGVRPYLTSPEANVQFFLFGMGTFNVLKEKGTLTYDSQLLGKFEEKYDDSNNKFGIAGGAGFEMPMTETLNLIIQGVFRMIFTEDEKTNFLGLTAGVVF